MIMLSVFWMGLLLAVSPCPMTANVAALAFMARRVSTPRAALWSGLGYALGQAAAYTTAGWLACGAARSVPIFSQQLQHLIPRLLGPVLLLTGLALLDWLSFPVLFRGGNALALRLGQGRGMASSFLLGAVLALSFCPVTAALFFGGLIPLALEHGNFIALVAVFAAGASLPVVAMALLVNGGLQHVGRVYDATMRVEHWARRVTGGIFVGIGVYFTLKYAFKIFG